MKKVKVLEVNVDDHLYGGVYVLVTNIIKNLPDGITADIAALEPFDDNNHIEELKKYGTTVYYVGSARNKILKQLDIYRNVKKLVQEKQYDVVHLHSDVSHKILISALAARKAQKLVFHSHSNDAEGKHIFIRRAFHKLCCVFLRKIPAVYVATSEEAGRWMFPWAKNIEFTVLDNGIDYQRYEFNAAKREDKRNELAIQKDEFLIGLFGRLVIPKNPFYALDILQAVLEKDDQMKMLCIGEGPLKQDFMLEIKKRGIEDRVIIIGNTDSLEDYYQAIDALIMPSSFEGFGLVAVESQISGTPTIVSTNVPGKTKISDLIEYIPIYHEAISQWCDQLMNAKSYQKRDIRNDIDHKFEIRDLVSKVVAIYEK